MTTRDSLLILLLSAIWGASFILIKLAGDSFPPSWVALLRLASGAAVLWVALCAQRLQKKHREKPLPSREVLLPLIAVAVLNNAIPFTFIAWGEHTIPSNLAAILNATTTLWGLLFAFLFQHDKLSRRMVAGVILGFAGVSLAVTSGQQKGDVQWLGVGLVAFGSVSYAVATSLAKAKLKGYDPTGLATAQLTLGVLIMLPVATVGPWPAAVTLQSVVAVSLLGAFGTGIAYLIYYGLLARIASVQVQAVTCVLPVWGLFWGAVAGESVGLLSILGVFVVLSGLMLLRK